MDASLHVTAKLRGSPTRLNEMDNLSSKEAVFDCSFLRSCKDNPGVIYYDPTKSFKKKSGD